MRGINIVLSAERGHFKRPETNNNPVTYSYMHKCAFVGLVGAVAGIERVPMAALYPQLCDDLLYGIQLLNPIIKEPQAFTGRKVISKKFFDSGRRYCEYLREPKYDIVVALVNERSADIFNKFAEYTKANRSTYPAYLGVANCQCDFDLAKDVQVSEKKHGEFVTQAVFSSEHTFSASPDEDIVFEAVPTHEKDWFYTPSRIVTTVCPFGKPMTVSGDHHTVDGGRNLWMM